MLLLLLVLVAQKVEKVHPRVGWLVLFCCLDSSLDFEFGRVVVVVLCLAGLLKRQEGAVVPVAGIRQSAQSLFNVDTFYRHVCITNQSA
jgi:hypothetical protein